MGCEVSFRNVNQLINNVKGKTLFRCIVFSYSISYCGTPIVIDGLFSDWNDVSSHIDPEGDCLIVILKILKSQMIVNSCLFTSTFTMVNF